jgi:predicted DNA binding CopG/RHH family protein
MLITESLNSFGRWQNQSSSNSISTHTLDSSVFHLLKLNFTTNPHLQDDTKVKSAFLQKTKFDSHAQQQHTNMRMSEKCLLVCCRKAATNGFTHAAISLGPLVRITISTGLLLTAAVLVLHCCS